MSSQSTFSTERLQLAIFLHATGRLRFLGCEPNGNGKVRFAFGDPQQVGAQAELEFERGALVAGTALFASQKYLRRQMTDALNRKNGVSEHGTEKTR
jgi:hypothetical protein